VLSEPEDTEKVQIPESKRTNENPQFSKRSQQETQKSDTANEK
jgi:hypothetical protein